MLSLERNKQTIYYALYQGSTDVVDSDGFYTGEKTSTYCTPVEMRVNVSPARGDTDVDIFGINEKYSKTLVTTDMNCPITETTRLWIGIDTTEPYNYRVVRVAKSLNSIVIAIEEVSVS